MNEAQGLPAPPESDVRSGPGVEKPGVDTPGALLKRERERRALSVEQAAEDLHLDPWIIEAIEANRFQALGAPVYAKGHLRKYAAQLALPVDDIVARYDSLQDRPAVIDPIPNAMVAPLPAPRRSFKGVAMTIIGLVIVAALTWLIIEVVKPHFERGRSNAISREAAVPIAPPAPSAPAPAASETPNTVESVSPSEQPVPATSSEPQAPPASTPATAPIATPVSEPAASSASAAQGAVQVRLQFSGDSWTEIYDAQGARLMYAMGSAGRTRTVSGAPPLQMTVGSVSAVTLEVNGEPVVIPRRDGRESSRFVIEADGNLR